MDRRRFLLTSLAAGLGVPRTAGAQSTSRLPRIGILRSGAPPDPLIESFTQQLRALGYVDGRSVRLEYRWAEGRDERLRSLADDLVRLKVDLIVASATAPALAAKRATATIPIVMPTSLDPVRLGLVASLARPGGNITGLTSQNDALPGKWVALLKEAFPTISRVAALYDPQNDVGQSSAVELGARALGLQPQLFTARAPADFDKVFAEAQRANIGGFILMSSAFFYAHRTQLIALAARYRLPTIYHLKEYVERSGLMSYGADFHDLFRRAAGYVDKILKGANPIDLPIEQATMFEFAINLRTAKALGFTIPPSLVARADQVIE